jgi:hypothetical protein
MLDTMSHVVAESRARSRLKACLEAEAAETFLELLLGAMKLSLLVDPDLSRSVAGFEARYRIATRDGSVCVGASFADGRLSIEGDPTWTPHAALVFRDTAALMAYFATTNPDLFSSLLNQDVFVEGNLNYVYRLAFLARHVQLRALGRA